MKNLDKEISHFVEMIWSSLLGLTVSPLEPQQLEKTTEWPVCAIQITGGWNGWVVLNLAPTIVNHANRAFFGEGADPPAASQVEETLKELANLLGGNLKNLAPPPSKLKFPVVSLQGTALSFPGTQMISHKAFRCLDSQFEIRLLEQHPETHPARETKDTKKRPVSAEAAEGPPAA